VAKFQPGHPKPEGSGRKKGTLNKATVLRQELIDALEAAEFDPATEWVNAIRAQDLDTARAIMDAWAYLYAKKAPRPDGLAPQVGDEPLTTEQLKGLVQIARGT
jgi:hypothetical protein